MVRLLCENCGCEFYREQRNGHSGPKRFCSPRCRYERMRGREHQNFNGGRYLPVGNDYVTVLVEGHPRAHKNRVKEHILVMERETGAPLPPGAEVHHMNGNKKDNRPLNLVVCSGRKEHMILEEQCKRYAEFGCLNVKRCATCKAVKLLDDFHRRSRSWDERGSDCKECNIERVKRSR